MRAPVDLSEVWGERVEFVTQIAPLIARDGCTDCHGGAYDDPDPSSPWHPPAGLTLESAWHPWSVQGDGESVRWTERWADGTPMGEEAPWSPAFGALERHEGDFRHRYISHQQYAQYQNGTRDQRPYKQNGSGHQLQRQQVVW